MDKAQGHMLKADRDLLAARFEKKRAAWERARRHGMIFFVATRWTLRLGGPLCLWLIFSNHYLHSDEVRGVQLLLFLAFALVSASFVGVWDWYSNERRYRKR